MADNATVAEKRRIKEEKKRLKADSAKQRKEVKKRAKEIAAQEAALSEDEESNGVFTFFVTIAIIAVWLIILAWLIHMDVGGFGTQLTPILKDIPVINKILPKSSVTETDDGEVYGGYTSLKDAVDQITYLELELEKYQESNSSQSTEIAELQAEVARLKEFENMQVEFQKIKTAFYEEVIYAEEGPGPEAYVEYYEGIDPTTAAYLYQQALEEIQETEEIEDYARAYSEMKPKEAAAIFEEMENNLQLVARILNVMNAQSRGAILGAMDPTVAAKVTKIMDPES